MNWKNGSSVYKIRRLEPVARKAETKVSQQPLVIIVGPTAVGKTESSIQLAKQFHGEIISGDSMQVYRGMDIGTAKVSKGEQEGIPHYQIDTKDPTESYSVAEFQTEVRQHIDNIFQRGHMPFLVGGTGLYVQSVVYDYRFGDEVDLTLRTELEERATIEGIQTLWLELQRLDDERAQKTHPNNERRVIRALESAIKGQTMTDRERTDFADPLYDCIWIGLSMERERLYDRINRRVDLMVKNGLLEEARRLYEQGVQHTQAAQAIGYKEVFLYLDGIWSWEEAIEQIKVRSRRFAKRQLTWFRNKMPVQWFDMTEHRPEKLQEMMNFVEGELEKRANSLK
ncbi:tRNA (adenosine(37)-N6)-dimethylallyltransferase MiaA [Bacillus fonticola]|uniref:tRNA (adenosine(37)-N6)-dimethylallyltransferase MiaA n=1 Tax=Bacillus fonticola TaxID=2728853 RepID=UPI001473D30E|nr:tRNA (adenosine(37)-N6)-dimethylallyltransferase MiaA [Bacillus fonticola]